MPTPTKQPKISILVVNYNGASLLPGCLESIATHAGPACETVVVDNNSNDESLKVLARYDWVRVVSNKQNQGFAGGNNVGLASCSGDYVLLLNNDTIVRQGAIQALSDYLDVHTEVGAAQGKMLLPRHDRRLDVCGSFFTSLGLPYHYGYFKPDGPQYCRNYPIFSGKGAFLMFRRDVIGRIGDFLFDERFFCYYEESDFCHRCWLSGQEVHFVATPPIEHLSGATGERTLRTDSIQNYYMRNMVFSLLGNLSASSLLRIMPLFLGIIFFRLLVFALTLKGGPLRSLASALAYNLVGWKKIWQRRRLVGSLRRKSDAEIFKAVLRNPRFDYFLKTFKGRIAEYKDEEPV